MLYNIKVTNQPRTITWQTNQMQTFMIEFISKALNRRSYWVVSKNDIKPGWFKNAGGVGITAGASTPDSTTKSIIKHIKTLS